MKSYHGYTLIRDDVMQFIYDKEADALAIWFRKVTPSKTIDLADDIFMDVDENGKLAGIEILHASEKTNLMDLRTISVKLPDNQRMEMKLPKLTKK
jgi:uncharacterized protein YuzE